MQYRNKSPLSQNTGEFHGRINNVHAAAIRQNLCGKRSGGHEKIFQWPGDFDSKCFEGKSVDRPLVRFFQPAERPGKDPVVASRGVLSICPSIGTGAILDSSHPGTGNGVHENQQSGTLNDIRGCRY